MNNSINSYEETLFASIHPDIITKRNSSSIAMAIAFLLLGMAIFSTAFLVQESYMALCMLLLVIGAGLLGYGLYCLFGKGKKKIYRPTGSEIKENILFFDITKKNTLLSYLEKGMFQSDSSIHSSSNGGIRLDILRSVDGKFAAAQLMEFEPYSFYPASPIYYYKEQQANELRTFISKTKM